MIQWLIVDLISVPSSSHSAVMIKCGGRGGGGGGGERGEVESEVRRIRKQISHGVNNIE